MAIGAVHLAGLALAAWALCIALRRCYREREFVVTGLAVAVIVVTAAYLFSLRSASFLGLREMAGVLPMTAVLARAGSRPRCRPGSQPSGGLPPAAC